MRGWLLQFSRVLLLKHVPSLLPVFSHRRRYRQRPRPARQYRLGDASIRRPFSVVGKYRLIGVPGNAASKSNRISSRLTPTTFIPAARMFRPAHSAWYSCRHGSHHVRPKFTSSGFPRYCATNFWYAAGQSSLDRAARSFEAWALPPRRCGQPKQHAKQVRIRMVIPSSLILSHPLRLRNLLPPRTILLVLVAPAAA